MAERRRDPARRKETEEFLKKTENHAAWRQAIISSRRHYVRVAEVIRPVGRNHALLVVVRDDKGALWEVRACPKEDAHEPGIVRDCTRIKAGMQLVIELREVWMVAPQTVCYVSSEASLRKTPRR